MLEVVERRNTEVSYVWGYPVYRDAENIWRWDDDDSPVEDDETRICPSCGKNPEWCDSCNEYHDGCTGHVPGMGSVCCGHGVPENRIAMPNFEINE